MSQEEGKIVEHIPLKRLGQAEDIAKLDFALASMAVKVGMTRHAGFIERYTRLLGKLSCRRVRIWERLRK